MGTVVYQVWSKSYTGKRFIDVWGVSRAELESIPRVELVIGPSNRRSLSLMVDTQSVRNTISELESRYGAIDIAAVQKSSTA